MHLGEESDEEDEEMKEHSLVAHKSGKEKKLAVKAMKKKFLALVHLYQEVDTSKCAGYITKACIDKSPEVIAHIA